MKKNLRLLILLCGILLFSACTSPQTEYGPSDGTGAVTDPGQSADSRTRSETEESVCDHTYGEWTTVTAAGEGTEGLQKRICTHCGSKEESLIPAIPVHVHKYTETVYLPDCTEDGFTEKVCACGHTVRENEIRATGHKYGEWIQLSAPTPEKEGEQQRTCSACGFKENQRLEKLPPPPAVHVHEYTETDYDPTCIAGGYTLSVCSCGDSIKTEGEAATGHSYGEWALCLEPGIYGGLERRDCEVCQEVEMKTVPPLPQEETPPPTPDPDAPPEFDTDNTPSHTGSASASGGEDEEDTEDEGTPSEGTPPPPTITYYSQRDERWGNEAMGCGVMKNNGCGPSAIAMAMSYFGIEVTPYEVAVWLYENTIEFNHAFHGISGTGLKLGLEHYGRNVVPITSYEEFLEHLEAGAVVVGCQGKGHFVNNPLGSHCVTMLGLEDGKVECYDPYTPKNNGWYKAEELWAERSLLEVDLRQEGITHYAVY